MGGLAGHMSHLYDNPDLTFGEIEDIFIKASSGALVGTEKTDGQNIFLSYSVKNKKAVAARNITNIKKGGMTASELADKFAGRGNLEKSFTDSFAAFEKAVNMFPLEKQIDIFGPDANIWYNAEIQDPRTSNVINYDDKSLTIHRVGHKEFDKQSGKPLDKDVSAHAEQLEDALGNIQSNAGREEYKVQVNALKNLDSLGNDEALNVALSRLFNLMESNHLTKSNTVMDFLSKRVKEVINKVIPEADDDLKHAVLERIFKVKGSNLRKIIKMIDPEDTAQIKKVRNLIDKAAKVATASIFPLEDIVHDFSVEMLKGLESAFVLDNAKEVKRLRSEVAEAIKAIEKSNNEEALGILAKQMKKLKDVENVSTAAEGFVFDYDGVSYKFTGNFAPVNQLLGLFRYGRGNVPAMQIDLEEDLGESGVKADVAFIPGSFKPPHKGHLKLMKDYLKYADRVEVLISEPNMGGDNVRWINLPPRKEGDAPLELMIDADTAADLFEHYIELEGLSDKITVPRIWNGGSNNPIQYIFGKISDWESQKKNMNVVLGVSTKDEGDENRFKDNKSKSPFKDQEYVRVKDIPLPPDPTKLRANDFRKSIAKAWSTGDLGSISRFLPEKWVAAHETPAKAALDFIDMIGDAPVKEKEINEASSCAGGAIQGSSGGQELEDTLIREEDEDMKEYMISREEFIEELFLREKIREKLTKALINEKIEESKVRDAIRAMIQEEVKDAPYKSTGINELETLLKKIIPVIEPDYKSLTTASEQRESFRAHILNAVQNSLSPTGASGAMHRDDIGVLDLPSEEDFGLEEDGPKEEINIAVSDDKFIDIDEKPPTEEDEEEKEFSLEGEEETGRNFASMTWGRIETNIVDSYRKLSNNKDRDLFYDYLIANLKLYFDKFEDELSSIVDEPESDIYDQETNKSPEEDFELGDEEAAI
tara:strand:- start:10172 stop:12973 length:2802 start_codon:yes stop_codon:yes gene_type:complete